MKEPPTEGAVGPHVAMLRKIDKTRFTDIERFTIWHDTNKVYIINL